MVYCYQTEEVVSASSLAQAVSSFGGAGYVLEYSEQYYVSAAAYNNYNDALSVCKNLNERGFGCGILTAQRNSFKLASDYAVKNTQKLENILEELCQIYNILYECANMLDTGDISADGAKSIVADVKICLDGLIKADQSGCFANFLNDMVQRCNEFIENNIVYSKDIRFIQIAAADAVLSVELR